MPVERRPPSSVSLVYRSAPGKRERPAKPGTTAVPTGLADAIRGRHGVDVADVPVHRGPEVAAEARSLGARAFTRGGEVFLPDEAGALDTPKARGLLAHELVHVVQQRTLGSSLPSLSTPAGAELEAEAVAAEHEHAGHAHPAPLVHPALTQVISQAARTVGVQLAPLDSGGGFTSVVSEAPSAPPPVSPAPSTSDTADVLSLPARQEVDRISEANAIRMFEQMTNEGGGGSGLGPTVVDSYTAAPSSPVDQTVAAFSSGPPSSSDAQSPAEQEMANQILQVINMDRSAKGQPSLAALDAATMEQVRVSIAEQNAATNRSLMLAGASSAATQAAAQGELATAQPNTETPAAPAPETGYVPLDYTDELSDAEIGSAQFERDPVLRNGQLDLERVDMEELSARLYDKLRSRLRLELLVDRERAGLLSDFR